MDWYDLFGIVLFVYFIIFEKISVNLKIILLMNV